MEALQNWAFLSSDAHVAGALLGILGAVAKAAGNLGELIGLVA
ncbi:MULTISPECIES: hypothetical protein [Corynebacterium]|nr:MULTISPECIES: hypothetical protein [Corynebacterium]WJZ13936.1 hypothetical protein CGOTT_10195 [Corynebacterium gottingense]WJZ16251.1 hypothetical protein CGOTTB_10145 [Corynebacterium gottingense]WKC60971.1 hypothetical protein CHAD_10660 [Corynebacterium hadale]